MPTESSTLRRIRESEGVQRAELARLSGVSERTLRRVEAGILVSAVMQNRIVNALNRLPNRHRDYATDDLYESMPHHDWSKEG